MAELLHEELTTGARFMDKEYKELVPEYIYDNLRKDFIRREYQEEAFGRFVYYMEEYKQRPKDTQIQLLYHMATGSGKTLIMAGLILYLYKQGYRNFLFFVNSTNIIDKTRSNFLDPNSPKYLFDEHIEIEGKQIRVKEVDNFQAANTDDINIVFSTIQGLHSRLNTPKENTVTYEDFEDSKTVLISDEAHHINAETKKGKSQLSKAEAENINSWEETVYHIFHASKENLLLEFTATVDLAHPDIKAKYQDKIIYDYPLKQFRKDGYSKNVKVLQADLEPVERALRAVILSQYRLKLFEKYKIRVKPVVMFKANYVNPPSKKDKYKKVVSSEFREQFLNKITNLDEDDLQAIKSTAKNGSVIKKAFNFFEEANISLDNLALEIKDAFSDEKCLSIDTENESEENQIAVNTLEDENNQYRAVFAVDKLNEGWDVLNLFDIVRLYDIRDGRAGKPGPTTISEAQLIGRGARYYPFQLTDDQPLFQRKYDNPDSEEEEDLKICEEIYYHSFNNPRYIDELYTAMEEKGIIARERKQQQLTLKFDFKDSEVYNKGKIYLNDRKKYKREDVNALDEVIKDNTYKYQLRTGFTKTLMVFETQNNNEQAEIKRTTVQLTDFGERIVRKALNKLEFYHFDNLKRYYPNLESVSEFINSDKYLKDNVRIEIEGPADKLQNLSPDNKLNAAVETLDKIASQLSSNRITHKGTKQFVPYNLKDTIHDKTITIARDPGDDQQYGESQNETSNQEYRLDLTKRDWYVFNDNYGTSEEKYFVKFIDSKIDELKEKCKHVYLVRNERHFKIYDFKEGKPFEPDFVLYLVEKDSKKSVYYQIFIEPKGTHLIEHDEWKQQFLLQLKDEAELVELQSTDEYTVWGLPFYNEEQTKSKFEEELKRITD